MSDELIGELIVQERKKHLNKKATAVFTAIVIAAMVLCALVFFGGRSVGYVFGKVDELAGRMDTAEQNIATLTGRADTNDKRVDGLEDEVGEVCDAAYNAWDVADKANGRQDNRVAAENRKYKQMLAYIRGANPSSSLVKLTDKKVNELLTNGVWDVEPKIEAEYNDLVSKTASSAADRANKAQIAANVGQMLGDQADRKATQALAAGEAAVSGLQKIADQPNRFFGKSVNKSTKEAVTADLAEYCRQYDADAKVK